MFPHGETPAESATGETTPAPGPAAVNANGNGPTIPDVQVVPEVKDAGNDMALAAFVLAVSALAISTYVYITREVPKP